MLASIDSELIKNYAMDKNYKWCHISSNESDYNNKKQIEKFISLCNLSKCLDRIENAINTNQDLDDFLEMFLNNVGDYPLTVPASFHVSKIAETLAQYLNYHDYLYDFDGFKANLKNNTALLNLMVPQELTQSAKNKLVENYKHTFKDRNDEKELRECIAENFGILRENCSGLMCILYGHFFECVIYELLKNDEEKEKSLNELLKTDIADKEIIPPDSHKEILQLIAVDRNKQPKNIIENIEKEIPKLFYHEDYVDIIIYRAILETIDEVKNKSIDNDNIYDLLETFIKMMCDFYSEGENIYLSLKRYILYGVYEYLNNMIQTIERNHGLKFKKIYHKIDLTKNLIHGEADYIISFEDIITNKEKYLIVDAKCYKNPKKYNFMSYLIQTTGYKHQINNLCNKPTFKAKNPYVLGEFAGYLIINPFKEFSMFEYYICYLDDSTRGDISLIDEIYERYMDKIYEYYETNFK